MTTKKSIPTIALAATLAACGGSSSSDDDASNGGPTNPTYADCSAGTQDLDGITYTFPATDHGKTSQATGVNSIEGGEQNMIADAYCNDSITTLSNPQIEDTSCNEGYKQEGNACTIETASDCIAGTITTNGVVFEYSAFKHGETQDVSTIQEDDYGHTTSTDTLQCDNSSVSSQGNFNQTTEHKELDQSTIIQALQDFYAMAQSSQENNVTFYGTLTDDNNNTYSVNYTNLKGENDLEGILMGHIPDQPDQNVYVIGKDPTGLAYLDFQTEKQGLQDINITADDLVNNDSNVAGTIQEGITLPELQEQMTSLEEGNFEYTDGGLLVYIAGGNASSNPSSEFLYALRNQNDSNREDHGETRNNLNIFSGIGPNYSFGTPFLRDNSGSFLEVETDLNFNPIGSYNDGTFNLNQNLIDIIEGIQKLDKSQIPNASYSLMIPISNTSNGNTINFPLGPFHKGLMGIPTMTKNENNRIDLGAFEYCSGNGTYDNELDGCR